jgi:NAD(P)-dependent dehydrogenase (short-subunit alcohol dehydrogenase family)
MNMVDEATSRHIHGKTVLVTGAFGGIGSELVKAFLQAGAARVIAAGRSLPASVPERVSTLQLDVTSTASVADAAARVGDGVDIVVNNSGVNANQRLLGADLAAARQEMDVNFFGLMRMFQAFAPAMKERGSGTFVNMLTVLAHANLPIMATYCASKAAALSLTQAMRAELEPFGLRVCAVLPAAVDTSMSADIPPPKLSPAQLAADVVAALREGMDDIYPGAAAGLRQSLQKDAKAVERMLASRLPRPA